METQSTDITPLIYLNRDSINIHKTTFDSYTSKYYNNCAQIEEFYATHFTCLESSHRYLNLGFTSHLGLQAEYKVNPQSVATIYCYY